MGEVNINDYAVAYVLGATDQLHLADAYLRKEEIVNSLVEEISQYLVNFDIDKFLNSNEISLILFEALFQQGMFDAVEDGLAGSYLAYKSSRFPKFRDKFLSESPIHAVAERVGGRFYRDAFDNYIRREVIGEEYGAGPESSSAPASDRIVTFSDNQITDIEAQTDEVIKAVASQNQIDDNPGLREIILGQLKAGRELIRAGSFRLHVIEITLIETLNFLVKRYEREVIGGLAAALITALVKHIGIDS